MLIHTGTIEAAGDAMTAWQDKFKEYAGMLDEDQTLVAKVKNRLGMERFAGYKDADTGSYFAGITGYEEGVTHKALSLTEYKMALKCAGFSEITVYYPYPDYDNPTAIYSDERLPHPGELYNIPNMKEVTHYDLFDEEKALETLTEEGVFQTFSDTYIIVARTKRTDRKNAERVIYSKFSKDRDDRYKIKTDIVIMADGTKVVRKYPLNEMAVAHIKRLGEIYKGGMSQVLKYVPVDIHEEGDTCYAQFPWVFGRSLQDVIKDCLAAGDFDGAQALIIKYIEIVRSLTGEMSNLDLIFTNILVEEGVWTVIDYEWSYKADIPRDFVIYRGLHYLAAGMQGTPYAHHALMSLSTLLELANINTADAARYAEWEKKFQAHLLGGNEPQAKIAARTSPNVIGFYGNAPCEEKEAARLINLHEYDTKKIVYNIDTTERDGKFIFISGWAVAKTGRKTVIPARISIFDESGEPAECSVTRIARNDVCEALNIENKFAFYGFSARWRDDGEHIYTLRISAGTKAADISLGV